MSADNLGAFQVSGPQLKVAVEDLRPTQMTVGMREVAEKQAELEGKSKDERHEFLAAHPVPVVRGLKGQLYPIDHHHLLRALLDAGFHHAMCAIVGDLSTLAEKDFWAEMLKRHWAYPHDAKGKLHPCTALPQSIADLADDPYRSLAGALRKAGGYAKSTVPFTEFQWADFLRDKVDVGHGDKDFDAAVAAALKIAHMPAAAKLPGYSTHPVKV